MTALVARLAGSGLVQRRADPGDRRAVLLALTPAGAELLDRRRAARAQLLTGPLGGLDDDEVAAIAAALPALARLAHGATPPSPPRTPQSRTGGPS
jgi:DNA-binding MarR family transcriptional regulator